MRTKSDPHLVVTDFQRVFPKPSLPGGRIRNLENVVHKDVQAAVLGVHESKKSVDLVVDSVVDFNSKTLAAGD